MLSEVVMVCLSGKPALCLLSGACDLARSPSAFSGARHRAGKYFVAALATHRCSEPCHHAYRHRWACAGDSGCQLAAVAAGGSGGEQLMTAMTAYQVMAASALTRAAFKLMGGFNRCCCGNNLIARYGLFMLFGIGGNVIAIILFITMNDDSCLPSVNAATVFNLCQQILWLLLFSYLLKDKQVKFC